MVEPATDAVSFNPELLVVTAVASATSFTVARGAAGGGAVVVADLEVVAFVSRGSTEILTAAESNVQ